MWLLATVLTETPSSSLVANPICDSVANLAKKEKCDAGDGDQEWSGVSYTTRYDLLTHTVTKSSSDDEKKRCV